MAGIASTVSSSIIQALAFTGSSFLFSQLNHSGYVAEQKRYHDAIIKLTEAKEKWQEKEVKRKEKINQLERELQAANQDINQTNKALLELSKYKSIQEPEPKLEDYYHPSNEAKEYQMVATAILGFASGFGAYKVALMLL